MAVRLLGIDAGFTAMGVVVAEDDRIIYAATCRTEKNAGGKKGVRVADDDAERAQQLGRFLLVTIGEWHPAGAVVELPSGGAQGARANRAMGMSTGIVTTALEATGLAAEWVTPAAVKLAAAGKRDASKGAVAGAVGKRFTWTCDLPKTKAEQEHIFDAAGAILAAQDGTMIRALRAREAGATA